MNKTTSADEGIVKVFQSNLKDAFEQIIEARQSFPYIAIVSDILKTFIIFKSFFK